MKCSLTITSALASICILVSLALASQPASTPCRPFVGTTILLNQKTQSHDIRIEVPRLCQPAANETVFRWATNLAKQFANSSSSGPDPDHWPYPLTARAALTSQWLSILSMKFDIMEYTGGAHPNHFIKTFVFDMTNGKRIGLADLFSDTTRALSIISRQAQEQLTINLDRPLDDSQIHSLRPKIENYPYFCITKHSLIFFFPPYHLASYADGEQNITVQLSSLEPWLAPKAARALGLQ